MEKVFVRSKMREDDFRDYLFYKQFYLEKAYIPFRIFVSAVIGAGAAYLSDQKIAVFVIVTLLCAAALLAFPWIKIRNRYRQTYRRNQSGAFHQFQDFEFGTEQFGFKSEQETAYDYEKYENLYKAAETKNMFLLYYSKKQSVVAVKAYMNTDEEKFISRCLEEKLGKRYELIRRF